MKTKAILVSIIVLTTLLVGCTQAPTTDTTDSSDTSTDVVTTASIVDTAAAFENAISAEGTWIIATTKDITIDTPLTLNGTFVTDDNEVKRKIGLYTQDEDRNVTARFVLTAPSLTINSPNASIEHGTFVGDVYVSADNFQLKDATIKGNLYFTTPTAQSTFLMDGTSSVTGVQELVQQ
ncbi:hypothetical protein [Acetobacterium bakii]|uniref:Lipoprotein n=1 Tax=Acetobacterium bakii TaxID=52689 RepID=A0A0L6U4A8_9FIRM|nr:hypothetical protein [Acetobacterium bakii]KNZ43336.1 hypothetical protein AKG39_01135 [Acetobacterium bakii]